MQSDPGLTSPSPPLSHTCIFPHAAQICAAHSGILPYRQNSPKHFMHFCTPMPLLMLCHLLDVLSFFFHLPIKSLHSLQRSFSNVPPSSFIALCVFLFKASVLKIGYMLEIGRELKNKTKNTYS